MKAPAQELKSLKTHKGELSSELRELKEKQRAIAREINSKQLEMDETLKRLAKLTDGEIIVTEHAIYRYLERVLEMPMDEVRNAVLPEETRNLVLEMGNGEYPVGKSHRIVVFKHEVVTIKK